MNNKIKSILLGGVLLSIGVFVGFKVFVSLDKIFEEEYTEYEQVTNMNSNENVDLYREQVDLYNSYVGKNIKDIHDERLEDWPNNKDNKEENTLLFKSLSGYKVTIYYNENNITTNIKVEDLK